MAYVFGDEVGRRVESLHRAWQTTVLRAYGHTPVWIRSRAKKKGQKGTAKLSPKSLAAYRAIDLHFHDLRRESASRWMDASVPLATIQRWLGHHNISQTSKYLGASLGRDEQDMRAFEERIGRVTYRDANAGSNGPVVTDTACPKNVNKNAVELNPSGVVH